MTALQDFTKARKAGLTTSSVVVPPAPVVKSTTPVAGPTPATGMTDMQRFAQQRSGGKTELQQFTRERKGNPAMNTLRWAGKELMKPIGVVATLAEQTGKAIGGRDFGEIAKIPSLSVDILSGARTRSFAEVYKESMPNHPVAGTILGTVVDIIGDPLNLIGGGLTKLGKLASIVEKTFSAGIKIEKGSQIANDIIKSGKTIEELVAISKMTKAEQAAEGARSFFKVSDARFLPKAVRDAPLLTKGASQAMYRATGAAGGAIKSIPIVGAGLEKGRNLIQTGIDKGRSIFSTSTGNKEADMVIQHFRNLKQYKEAEAIETAIKMQNDLIEHSKPEEMIQVANYLEKNIIPTNPKLKEMGDQLRKIYHVFAKGEQMAGLPTKAHTLYAPHINVPDEKGMLDFLSPKEFSTSLGAAESRDIIKLVSEYGKEIIGDPKKIGLKPVSNVSKNLSHDITWGQYKSIGEIEKVLKKYGIQLVFKKQKLVSRNALGYFDPTRKKIVIATSQPNLAQVMSTLTHELVHNAHFQIAGNIEMMENAAKTGRSLKWKTALDKAKNAVEKEADNIRGANGVSKEDFSKMSPHYQEYYGKPTELLARVAQTYLKDPAMAMRLFPESTATLLELRNQNKLFDLLSTAIPEQGAKITGNIFQDAGGTLYQGIESGIEKASIEEINTFAKQKVFEENPALQLAYRGVANAKAVSSAGLFHNMRQFAIPNGIEVAVPELKGLKFEPGVAKQLDAYHKAMQPQEIKAIFKAFDKVQNWWKGQALISPAYHLRNMVGNFWNNSLAKVGTERYIQAGKVQLGKDFEMVDAIGRKWNSARIMDQAKKSGVINAGQYMADIPTTIESAIKGGNLNLFSQENKLFQANKMVGGGIENNARLANFIEQLNKGLPVDEAAMEVKKYLFDYTDLTATEQNVLKRFMPFYTWTRKNLPLQLEQLVKQPGKYADIEKFVQAFENIGMGDSPQPNEKYISDYIKNNTAMRINYNPKDQSYNYFLLGNWMPSYQAMDFISQPTQNLLGMLTPILKTPLETLMNKSTFWRNSLNEYQNIERYPGEQTNFLGINMPKKTAQVLRNIRLLNDLDKANPGLIFGGPRGKTSIWAKMGVPAGEIPGVGNVSPSQFKYSAQGVNPNALERTAGLFLGKLTSYKPTSAQEFYQQDTNTRVTEIKTAIRRAAATGDNARVQLLVNQLNEFQRERGN
jgi:hypothetical protein